MEIIADKSCKAIVFKMAWVNRWAMPNNPLGKCRPVG